MCFKCCLTLSLHVLWMLHDWWRKASELDSRCCSQTTSSLTLPPLFLSVCTCPSSSLWTGTWCSLLPCIKPSSQHTGRSVSAQTLTNRDRDGGSHDSAVAHILCFIRRRTLTSWEEPKLVQWLWQCHLLFCLAVSIVCRCAPVFTSPTALSVARWRQQSEWHVILNCHFETCCG